MSSNSNITTYSFLDFQFVPSQHHLTHQNQNINLSKKNHALLMALVKSKGQVLEKDQLIDLIWPGQIVTDAALNKQITRLRQTLAEYSDDNIIDTIRGVGIRLVTDVRTETRQELQTHQSKKSVWLLTSIILVVLLLIWMFQKQQPTDAAEWDQITTVNMAIIPGIGNNDDWLNMGAIDFLSKQLLEYPEIQTIEPEMNWFNQNDAEVFGIELSQTTGIEYVLMLENQSTEGGYSADLSLRNSQQIIAKQSLQAASISVLLNQVEAWTLQQLNIETELSKLQQRYINQTTDFVMENYLRGLAAAKEKQLSQAQRLLKTATDQDPKFYPAWFALADVESELGHFDKALALIDTLISSGKLDTDLRKKLAPIQVKNLIYLNRLEEAQTLLDQSMQTAKANQDINTIMYNMNNQLLLNDHNGDHYVSDIALSSDLLALTKKFDPSPNRIGMRQHNLAITLNDHSKEEQAISTIKQAIENFKSTNNHEGLLSSYRVWAEIHAYLAQFGDAQLVLEQAAPYLPQVEGAKAIVYYWTTYAWVHYELGDLKAFQKSIDALNQMSIEYATLQPKVKALVQQADMAITHGLYSQSRTAVDALLEIISPNPEDYPIEAPYAVALDLILMAVMQPVAETKAKRADYLSAHPELAEWVEYQLILVDAYLLAAEGFKQQAIEKLIGLENRYLKTRDISFANDTNYVIIRLLIANLTDKNNNQTVKAALDRLENRDHFAYPFKKFKSQWLAQQNKLIQAITLMSELKVQANDYWTAEDQLLLESWQAQNSQPMAVLN